MRKLLTILNVMLRKSTNGIQTSNGLTSVTAAYLSVSGPRFPVRYTLDGC